MDWGAQGEGGQQQTEELTGQSCCCCCLGCNQGTVYDCWTYVVDQETRNCCGELAEEEKTHFERRTRGREEETRADQGPGSQWGTRKYSGVEPTKVWTSPRAEKHLKHWPHRCPTIHPTIHPTKLYVSSDVFKCRHWVPFQTSINC